MIKFKMIVSLYFVMLQVPMEVHRVTLFKDNVYEDFGFSVSDGLYEKGIFVNRVRAGGPADGCGLLRPLDRILQINSTRTTDFDCCLAVPLIASAEDRIELVISRATKVFELQDRSRDSLERAFRAHNYPSLQKRLSNQSQSSLDAECATDRAPLDASRESQNSPASLLSNNSFASTYSTKLTQLPIYKRGSPVLDVGQQNDISIKNDTRSLHKGNSSFTFSSPFSRPDSSQDKSKNSHGNDFGNHIEKGNSGNNLMNGKGS